MAATVRTGTMNWSESVSSTRAFYVKTTTYRYIARLNCDPATLSAGNFFDSMRHSKAGLVVRLIRDIEKGINKEFKRH